MPFDRNPLYDRLPYSANPMNYIPYPNLLEKEKDPVLLGVELELSTEYSWRQLVDAAEDPFFILKQDGSITGSKPNLAELVTAPSSFKYLKRQFALWFDKLDYNKFDTTTNTGNGMHVHVGKEHFEDRIHMRNFCWFLNNPANQDFNVLISERGTYQIMSRYSPICSFYGCSTKMRAYRRVLELVGNGFRGISNFKGGINRSDTIEVRMFKGIVSYASIVKNLEYVESLFYFTRSLSSYRELSLKHYLEFLNKTPKNRFTVLKEFLEVEKVALKKLLPAAEVKDIIFNVEGPHKILELIHKSGLKVTKEHLAFLNKRKRTKTFALDPKTGQLMIIGGVGSKLVHLDKAIANRYLMGIKKKEVA